MKQLTSLFVIPMLFVFVKSNLQAQDPTRFADQIAEFKNDAPVSGDNLIIFTGSSSVRMWKDVADRYSDFNIVNRGFGGSQMSDLLYYLDDIVTSSKPCQVFIYEGDNDINAGKSTDEILMDASKVLEKIWEANPDTEIVFISPKPSVARWDLKDKYLELNKELAMLAGKHENLEFVDVWNPALGADGKVRDDIFIEDNLHMNAKGYAIWEKTIKPYLSSCN